MRSHDRSPHVEILPPEGSDEEQIRALADFIARLLDTVIRIPGTPIRIGLDPLLGLIPVVGDAVSAMIGSSILFLASQVQVPKIVLARMSLNMFLNGAIGAIPGFGDAFSIWFKSNIRNAELLRRYSTPDRRSSTAADWAFVIGLIVAALLVMVAVMAGLFWLVARLWNLVA